MLRCQWYTLQWRHNGRDGVSNPQPNNCLINRLFRFRSKKTSKLRVAGLCAGNYPGTGEFPLQMASNAENVFIWWRHHDIVFSVQELIFRFIGGLKEIINCCLDTIADIWQMPVSKILNNFDFWVTNRERRWFEEPSRSLWRHSNVIFLAYGSQFLKRVL